MSASVRRPILPLLAATIGVALLAGPAAAATRYVAPKGSGGGSCATPNHRTIKAAIAKARAGDTILVCPGTYTGALTVTKSRLTFRATKAGKAVVTVGTGPVEDLIWIKGADRVAIRGLKLVAPTASCEDPVDTMIQVDGDANGVTIANTTMDVKGTASLDDCGYSVGVSVGVQSDATVTGNRIIDFKDTAIVVTGIGTSATIGSNVVRYEHGAYVSAEPFTDEGILVLSGAAAIVEDNIVRSLATSGHPAFEPDATPGLNRGIRISGAAAGTIVRRNTVRDALGRGILLAGASELVVRRNTITEVFDVALELDGVTDSAIAENTAEAVINEGILVQATSTGNTLTGSTAYGGADDCVDLSSGTGTAGTANTWIDNTGLAPQAICS
jgi:parallel beta-helix repeat protein